jgi:hypothetical protein
VGLTQLTSIGFIQQADSRGGAHKVRPQCRVGFGLLHGLIERHGEKFGIGAYDGGEGQAVYRKQIRPVLIEGADAMDRIFPGADSEWRQFDLADEPRGNEARGPTASWRSGP